MSFSALRIARPSLAGGLCLLAVAVLGCGGETPPNGISTSSETAPVDSGPLPVAVTPITEHDFGVMKTGEKGAYDFPLRNEGEAELRLSGLESSCKCTVGDLETDVVPPGEEATITVSWNPDKPYANFQQQVVVRTNDPRMSEALFTVKGKIAELIEILPGAKWDMGAVGSTREPVKLGGEIVSSIVDRFEIVGFANESGDVTVSWEPIAAEELVERELRSGYRVTAEVDVETKPREVADAFTLDLEVPEGDGDGDGDDGETLPLAFEIKVAGKRAGEIVLIPKPGTAWSPTLSILDLGEVGVREGGRGELILFVAGMEEGETFAVTSVDDPTEQLTVSTEYLGDVGGGKKQRHLLTIAAEPPLKPAAFVGVERAYVVLHTNHPRTDTIGMEISLRIR